MVVGKVKMKKLKASYTVENAVIIPLFTLIVLALIALGTHAGNVIMLKTMVWRSEVEMEMSDLSRVENEDLSNIEGELNESVKNLGLFVKNFKVSLSKSTNKEIEVKSQLNQNLKVPMFLSGEKITVNENAKTSNPVKNLKKWHAYISVLKEK